MSDDYKTFDPYASNLSQLKGVPSAEELAKGGKSSSMVKADGNYSQQGYLLPQISFQNEDYISSDEPLLGESNESIDPHTLIQDIQNWDITEVESLSRYTSELLRYKKYFERLTDIVSKNPPGYILSHTSYDSSTRKNIEYRAIILDKKGDLYIYVYDVLENIQDALNGNRVLEIKESTPDHMQKIIHSMMAEVNSRVAGYNKFSRLLGLPVRYEIIINKEGQEKNGIRKS